MCFKRKKNLKIKFLGLKKHGNNFVTGGDLIFRKPRVKIEKWLLRIKLKKNSRFKTLIE